MKTLNETELKAERIKELKLEKMSPKTGYPELDKIIGGFIGGHTYLLSGETNAGKTSLAANFACNVLDQMHRKILYISLEPGAGILDFFVAIRSAKKFNQLEESDYNKHGGKAIVAPKCKNVGDLIKFLKELSPEEKYDLVIIDHLGYFITKDNSNQEQANVIKQIAMIAKEKMIAIMPIAHTRKPSGRDDSDRVLSLNDIAGSAALKQDSTEVLMIQRYLANPEDKKDPTLSLAGYIRVLKTKKGRAGSVPIYFQFDSPKVKGEVEQKYL